MAAKPGENLKPIALTFGDPAGIGPEITLSTWLKRQSSDLPVFALIGDMDCLIERGRLLGYDVPCQAIDDIGEANAVFGKALPVLPLSLPCPVSAGQPLSAASSMVAESIERAVDLALSGDACAVVTNPIAKNIMAEGGFPHPGHTEYLGALGEVRGHDASPVMMLAGPGLRVVPVTVHIALADVPGALSVEKIVKTVQVTAEGLKRWFGIAEPRLALTGLNPHSGESGMMGSEEETVIKPALSALREAGLHVTGPHPADTLFHERARQNYDVAVAMYHDQALIPIKTIAFDDGVNVTLGLPFIRTSPDHGTAFDIAGSGKARPDALIAALKMAANMARLDKASS